MNRQQSTTSRRLAIFGAICGVFILWRLFHAQNSACKLTLESYNGPLWAKAGETQGRQCLLQTSRVRVDYHSRRLPDGGLVEDWLWLEYGDRVNVLVRHVDGSFYVFRQTKYALPSWSMAVIGGFIERGESAQEAAEREVAEEMQLVCQEYTALGRFRTDVNRGLGWVNAFLATGCDHATKHLASDDQETQALHKLNMAELQESVMEGSFVEVQWSNTVALAVLHMQGTVR